MAAKDKVILRGAGLYLARDKTGTFGNTALTAAAAAGAGTLTVTAITNFGTSDWIRVGSGETAELIQVHTSTAPTGSTITLNTNLRLAHAVGEPVVEVQIYDLGPATDAGVTVRYRGDSQSANVWDSRLPHAKLKGFVDGEVEFAFPNVSLHSFATAVGALLAKVTGSGTQASPLQFITDGTDFAGAGELTVIVVGKLFDNSDLVAYLYGAGADYTGIRLPLTRGRLAALPAKFIGANGAFDTTVPAFAADTTNKPTKGKVFDALTEAGVFEDAGSGGTSTVASGGAADSSTVTVASGTGFAAGDWVRFGTGNTMQIFQLDGVAGAVLTIRGKFLRALAVGDVVREQTLTLFDGVDQDGAELALSGGIERMRSALTRLPIGLRPGNAEATFRIPVIGTTLANLARVLGIPQAAVSGGRLLVSGGNVLTSTEVNGVYLKGTLLDGSSWVALGWGTDIDLSQAVELLVNNTGKPNTLPLTGVPSAGLALLNYT
jgi:hypothetical protein